MAILDPKCFAFMHETLHIADSYLYASYLPVGTGIGPMPCPTAINKKCSVGRGMPWRPGQICISAAVEALDYSEENLWGLEMVSLFIGGDVAAVNAGLNTLRDKHFW